LEEDGVDVALVTLCKTHLYPLFKLSNLGVFGTAARVMYIKQKANDDDNGAGTCLILA
jgi:hypothetical protein